MGSHGATLSLWLMERQVQKRRLWTPFFLIPGEAEKFFHLINL